MRATILHLVFTALFAVIATAQTPAQSSNERVFHFAHTATEQRAKEIATAVRIISDMKDVPVDFAAGTMTANGAADQLKLAEWMFIGMDRSVPVAPDSAVHEYRLPEGADNVVRLFYLDRGQSVQEFQEFVTLLRTIAEIRRVFTCNEGKILALRGTADQMAMADWFAGELAKTAPAPHPHSVTSEYLLPADPSPRPNENVTRIFFVANAPTVQDFQELATLMRTIAEIRRVFTYNTPRAIAIRGTSDQLALAEWLFNNLDQPTHREAQAAYNYQDPSRENANAVSVFYLPHTATVQDFQKIATAVRTATGIRRVFTHNLSRALVLRGTLDQVQQAQRLLPDLDPADFPKSQ